MSDHANAQHKDLSHGPIGRHLVRLTLPMLIGVLAMMGFNLVDTFFVGQLGTVPLAAMAVTFPVVMVLMSMALGLGVSTSIAVSHALGSGDRAAAKRLTTDALILGGILSVVFSVMGLGVLDLVLRVLEGDLPTHDYSSAYLRVWLPGLIFVLIPMVGSMAIRGTGDTVTPSAIIILGVLGNAVLDPLLIFGPGIFPRYGIAGAALATVIARGLTLIVVMWLLVARDKLLASPFVPLGTLLRSWQTLLRTGIPIALNNLITPVQVGVLTRLCAELGAPVVAGFGVASRVEAFGLTAVFALQSVMGIFIAHNRGAGRWDRVKGGVLRGEVFGLVYGAVVYLILLLVGGTMAAWFNPTETVVDVAVWYFRVAGLTFGLRAVYLVGSACLNSLDRAVDATILTVVHGLLIIVPAAWVGGVLWQTTGMFGGIALGNLVGGLSTAYWLRRALRKAGEVGEGEL